MRSTVLKFFAATLAAASMTAFAAPTYAATAEESSAQGQGAWCDVVPPFCGCNLNVTARCRCQPPAVQVKGVKAREDVAICPVFKE